MATTKKGRKTSTIATVRRQREVQSRRDREDEKEKSSRQAAGRGAGSRKRSEDALPPQHLVKPGLESELDPRPQFLAPTYAGSGKLQGMTALITGGDSGIGRAVAVLFAREGADVAIVYLSEDSDAQETKDYVEAEGRRCVLIRGDVTESEFCRNAVEQTIEQLGKLSVLVNNAAFQEHAASIEDITEDHFDLTLRTNLYGYFHMAKAASPHLGSGDSIINTGSETGLFGNDRLLDYSMTKGGIHAFTMALAANLVKRGIRVNAVAPGPVWTPLNPADQSPERVSKFGQSSAMGRPAQPEEIAPAYVFLAAPCCSSYISGAILPVLGGPTG
ncbi:MAG: SDR family oxidoreductase [Rhodanobacter sp.]|nr:MAG: SDR family oxidoreductase [Rhodanobacter sp.]